MCGIHVYIFWLSAVKMDNLLGPAGNSQACLKPCVHPCCTLLYPHVEGGSQRGTLKVTVGGAY